MVSLRVSCRLSFKLAFGRFHLEGFIYMVLFEGFCLSVFLSVCLSFFLSVFLSFFRSFVFSFFIYLCLSFVRLIPGICVDPYNRIL
jgi:hypothetical protein